MRQSTCTDSVSRAARHGFHGLGELMDGTNRRVDGLVPLGFASWPSTSATALCASGFANDAVHSVQDQHPDVR
jgi:hypothetical protein